MVYYIEEGTENKRSELFIFNTNADDNGTYICHAENAAGSVQANFTIKIVLKEDPSVIIVSFSLEYLMYTTIGVLILAFVTITVVTVCLLRCHKKRKRQIKTEQTKEMALHLRSDRSDQELNGVDKNCRNKKKKKLFIY